MRNNIIIMLLLIIVLTLALPWAGNRYNCEKAFTSDNLIVIHPSAGMVNDNL